MGKCPGFRSEDGLQYNIIAPYNAEVAQFIGKQLEIKTRHIMLILNSGHVHTPTGKQITLVSFVEWVETSSSV